MMDPALLGGGSQKISTTRWGEVRKLPSFSLLDDSSSPTTQCPTSETAPQIRPSRLQIRTSVTLRNPRPQTFLTPFYDPFISEHDSSTPSSPSIHSKEQLHPPPLPGTKRRSSFGSQPSATSITPLPQSPLKFNYRSGCRR